jgi:hypothetical protein
MADPSRSRIGPHALCPAPARAWVSPPPARLPAVASTRPQNPATGNNGEENHAMPNDDYYMLITDKSVSVESIVPCADAGGRALPAFRDPRTVWIADTLDGRVNAHPVDIVLGQCPQVRVVRVSPVGEVQPHSEFYSDPDRMPVTDHTPVEAAVGWLVESIDPFETILGPQGNQVTTIIREAVRVIEDGADPQIVRAYYQAIDAAGFPELERAHRAADAALDDREVDTAWWRTCSGESWGWEVLALAARDLIDTAPGWTQAEYDTLTTPWRRAFPLPLHPDDQPLSVTR